MDLLGVLGELSAPSTIILLKFWAKLNCFKIEVVEVAVHLGVVLTCNMNAWPCIQQTIVYIQLNAIVN